MDEPHSPPSRFSQRSFLRWFRLASGLVGIIFGLVLIARWIFGDYLQSEALAGHSVIRPNTALGLVLLGLAVTSLGQKSEAGNSISRAIVRAGAVIALLLGLLTAFEYVGPLDLHIDTLLVSAERFEGNTRVLRMAPATAAVFMLLGAGLLTLDLGKSRTHRASDYFVLSAALIALIAIFTYLYEVESLYRLTEYSRTSLLPAITLLLLSLGILAARPDVGVMAVVTSDRTGGVMARQVLPAVMLLPFLMGLLRHRGEQWGLRWELGLAAFAAITIAVFFTAVWLSARALNRLDQQREAAASTLRDTEERLETVVENLAEGIVIADEKGEILHWNHAALAMHEFTKFEEFKQRLPDFSAVFELVTRHGRVLPVNEWPMARLLRGEPLTDVELTVRKPATGWSRIFLFGGARVQSPGGKAIIFVTLTDITGRRVAEDSLAASEERFRQLAENTRETFWMRNAGDGRVLYVSPAYESIVGHPCERFYADPMSWLEVAHPADRERVATAAATCLQGTFDELFRLIPSGQQVRWIRARTFPIRDQNGEIYRIGGIASDVTATHNAAQRLELQHEVTSVLAEGGPAPQAVDRVLKIIAHKFDWEIGELWTIDVAKNQAICTETWHRDTEAINSFAESSRMFSFGPGEDVPGQVWAAGRAIWITRLADDASSFRYEFAARAGLVTGVGFPVKVGERLLAVAAFLTSASAEPDPALLSVFEIIGLQLGQFIERKEIEDRFRQSQKMESVGHLAGGIAHDFNNLLGIIQGRVALLNLQPDRNQEMIDSLGEISAAAERAATLTRQLMAFGNRQALQPRDLSLNATISDLLQLLRRVLGEDIDVQFEPSAKEMIVHADPGHIDQVLINLAVNSREAMPRGGRLTLQTSVEPGDSELARRHTETVTAQFACITVTDTGVGIDPAILPKIFEPFFTTKDVGQGSGLGLSTVYGIVKQQGGWINVTSEPRKGATFRLYLPALDRAETPTTETKAEPSLGRNETILLVEDEFSLRLITQIILEKHGYRVIVAETGREALEAWVRAENQIDLVLTDIVMPDGMTGHELGAQLAKRNPSVKVIYASGYNSNEVGQGFVLKEGVNFLQKPFDVDMLLATIRLRLDESVT